jgi:S1-C subfamily serine protease
VRRVLVDLRTHGRVRPAYRDFRVRDFAPWLAQYLEMEHAPGAIVWEMDLNGPAGQAGLQMGDVIMGFNSHPIGSARELEDYLFTLRVGEPIQLRVMRDGEPLTVDYVLAEGRH